MTKKQAIEIAQTLRVIGWPTKKRWFFLRVSDMDIEAEEYQDMKYIKPTNLGSGEFIVPKCWLDEQEK